MKKIKLIENKDRKPSNSMKNRDTKKVKSLFRLR